MLASYSRFFRTGVKAKQAAVMATRRLSTGKGDTCGGICPESPITDAYSSHDSTKGEPNFGEHYVAKGQTIISGHPANQHFMYTTGDPSWESAIIIFHDVHGPHGGDHKAICDILASMGFYVVMPDFFKGGSIKPWQDADNEAGGIEWIKEFDWAHCGNILEGPGGVYDHLDKMGIRRTGSIGFCWGCWVQVIACQKPEHIQAQVWCHPSLQAGRALFGTETEEELAALTKAPTLMLPSQVEPPRYSDGTLTGIMHENGVAADSILFADQVHGFVTRGAGSFGKSWDGNKGVRDLSSLHAVQRALNLALGWYSKYLFEPNIIPHVRRLEDEKVVV